MESALHLRQVEETLHELRAHFQAGRAAAALTGAWQLLDAAPNSLEAKLLVVRILRGYPELATTDKKDALQRLLNDPAIEPERVAPAGWGILRDSIPGPEPETTANWLESDEFARNLLQQTYVTELDVEVALTAMRRWLLLSERWQEFPRTTQALVAQAAHNGGAWLFDAEERARLDADQPAQIALAFRPRRPERRKPIDFVDPVTNAVAEQYEGWPFPQWTRANATIPTTLAATIKEFDPSGPDTIPARPDILIAGCGTGREPAHMALRYPDAKITAIDISRTSLDYAAERCAAAGMGRIEFRLLDLNLASELGRTFDAVSCCGALHHLPDPEVGWAALTGVLKPGGVMRVAVYSKIARLQVQARRNMIRDLLDRPVDDDLLRAVRRRLIEKSRVPRSLDFYTLGGVHDLLIHRHEDPFDIARIRRAIERLGLELLWFELPNEVERENYRRENPQDPLFRDYSLWSAQEQRQPLLFANMYVFWCRKPLTGNAPDGS